MSKRLFILLLALGIGGIIRAQIPYRFIDEDPEIKVHQATVTSKGQLAVVQTKKLIGFQRGQFEVQLWNGQFWARLPKVISESFQLDPENQFSITDHEGEIYVAGSFDNGPGQLRGLAKWDGNAWSSPAGGITSTYQIHQEISVADMQSFENQLFIGGLFNQVGSQEAENLVSLDNGNWTIYNTNGGTISSFTVLSDTLYIGGEFTEIEGVSSSNIIAYHQGNWISLPTVPGGPVQKLCTFNGILTAISSESNVGETACFQFVNGSWQGLENQWNFAQFRIDDAIEQNGELILSGRFNHDGNIDIMVKWNGKRWLSLLTTSDVNSPVKSRFYLDSYLNSLYFSGDFNEFKGNLAPSIIEFQPGRSLIKGKIYYDHNNNCEFDSGDLPIGQKILSVNDGDYYTSTDLQGNYNVYISNNSTTTLQVFNEENEVVSCNHELRYVETFNRDSTIIEDFAIFIKPEPVKLEGELEGKSGYKAKHGYSNTYEIHLDHLPHEYFPIQLELALDQNLEDFTYSESPYNIEDGTLFWEVSSPKNIRFSCTPNPLKTKAGDELSFQLNLRSIQFPNTFIAPAELNQTIVAAFDPNDKQCNYSEISNTEKDLEYHIRFQNLGTDSARDIFLVDTIDSNIPLQYLKVISTSHMNQYVASYKVRDHAVIWTFKNIELPPKSTAGDEASSGFVTFKTNMKPSLEIGDSITNKAHIYFDFQDAVITNTVVTRVVEDTIATPNVPNRENALVYPNPSNDIVYISISELRIEHIQIMNTAGQIVGETAVNPNEETVSIDLNFLTAGNYFIRMRHSQGVAVRQIIVAR
ncbi:T9SS type A sorting domain-containing protein [bacterium]|nr:T9SS type A sorting domain-containing protein [bacterium]